jgi:hypothetical protein
MTQAKTLDPRDPVPAKAGSGDDASVSDRARAYGAALSDGCVT